MNHTLTFKSAEAIQHGIRTRQATNAVRSFPAQGFLTQLVQQLRTWIDRAQQRRELAELDDYALRDIGVSRAQAIAEASRPFWR